MIGGIGVSLSGMNAASQKLATSAANIAAQDTKPDISLPQELVAVKSAEFAYGANAQMLATQIELQGTLLDILDDQ